jgi:hypothetical protein
LIIGNEIIIKWVKKLLLFSTAFWIFEMWEVMTSDSLWFVVVVSAQQTTLSFSWEKESQTFFTWQ